MVRIWTAGMDVPSPLIHQNVLINSSNELLLLPLAGHISSTACGEDMVVCSEFYE